MKCPSWQLDARVTLANRHLVRVHKFITSSSQRQSFHSSENSPPLVLCSENARNARLREPLR
jgi:hypothetical protein